MGSMDKLSLLRGVGNGQREREHSVKMYPTAQILHFSEDTPFSVDLEMMENTDPQQARESPRIFFQLNGNIIAKGFCVSPRALLKASLHYKQSKIQGISAKKGEF